MARRTSLIVEKDETMPVRNAEDVVRVRREVRTHAIGAGFNLVDQTKIVTAASEIARNTVDYGGGGTLRLETVRLTFADQGPGIADLKLVLTDGYSTGSGLGLGLSGAKRLSNEFDIKSTPGEGTIVTLVRWK